MNKIFTGKQMNNIKVTIKKIFTEELMDKIKVIIKRIFLGFKIFLIAGMIACIFILIETIPGFEDFTMIIIISGGLIASMYWIGSSMQ